MDKQLEYFEASALRKKEMMSPNPPNHEYESAWRCYKQENYAEAAELFEKSAEKYSEAEGSRSLNYAKALYAMGYVCIDLADEASMKGDKETEESLCEKKRKLHSDTLTIYERQEKTDNQQTELSILYSDIGSDYHFLKKYTDALEYYQKTLAIRERVLGGEHQDTAESYNDIGHIYVAQEKYNEALEEYHKARAINERVLGAAHPQVALDYGNMGCIYEFIGDYDSALEWRLKSYRVAKKYGETEDNLKFDLAGFHKAYKIVPPRKLFQRPKPLPFEDWLREQLSS